MRIFSGDGGGVFGIIPARQLAGYDVYKDFDVMGGCSISSAIVGCYAMGYSCLETVDMLHNALPGIFSRPWYRRLSPFGAKWPSTNLEAFCRKRLDAKMGELGKPLFIVSMDFAHRKPKVFSSVEPRDKDIPLYEAVLASVSAPTYFPPRGEYVDGGLFANNPTVAVAAGASKALGVGFGSMDVFSIGTGKYHNKPINMKNAKMWGLLGWSRYIVDVMINGGNSTGMSFIAGQLPFRTYVRSDMVDLKPGWSMDDASLLGELVDMAESTMPEFTATMDKFLANSVKGG